MKLDTVTESLNIYKRSTWLLGTVLNPENVFEGLLFFLFVIHFSTMNYIIIIYELLQLGTLKLDTVTKQIRYILFII